MIKIAEGNENTASTSKKPQSNIANKAKNAGQKLLKNKKVRAFLLAHLPLIAMIILILFLILYLVGLISFFMTMPGMILAKIKEFGASVWGNFQAAITGDTTSVKVEDEDVVGLAQYLQDMGYDVQGFGFGNIKYTDDSDTSGRTTKAVEKIVKPPLLHIGEYYESKNYLRSYIAANEATYTLATYSLNGYLNEIGNEFAKLDFIITGDSDKVKGLKTSKEYSSGMINVLGNYSGSTLELNTSTYFVSVDREKGTMNISNKVSLLGIVTGTAKLNVLSYDIDTYIGRYGRPTELFLALHLSTMMPDLTYEIATSQNFNTKVNLKNQDVYLQYTVKVQNKDGTSITNDEIITLFLNNCIEDYDDSTSFSEVMSDSSTSLIDSDDIIPGTPWTINQMSEYAQLVYNGLQGVSNVKWPYIDSVKNHWYYEDIDFSKTAYRLAKTATKTLEYVPNDEDTENEITLDADISAVHGIVYQVCEPEVKGPNQRIKNVFSKEYYRFDGTTETAKKITNTKAVNDNNSKYNFGGETFPVSQSAEDLVAKQTVNFSDAGLRTNALSAFSILKNVHTEAADYIYRDLKRLMEDLKYFTKEELMEDLIQVLLWPIKTEYKDQTWETKADKGEYGLKIFCNKEDNEDQDTVIAPTEGVIESVSGNTIKIKFSSISEDSMKLLLYLHKDDYKTVDKDIVNGMTLLIENISPNSSIVEGKTIKRGEELGSALIAEDDEQKSITMLLKSADGETVKNILSEKTKNQTSSDETENTDVVNTNTETNIEDIDAEKIYESQAENFYDYFDQKDNSKYEELVNKKMQQEELELNPLDLSGGGILSYFQQYNNRVLTTAEQEAVARQVWDYFVEKGWDEIHIAGVLGNFQGESSMNPGSIESNGQGIGLAQWSFSRKTALINYAASRGTDWSDLQTQLDFLVEADSDAPTARKYLSINFSSISDAAYWWAKYWERPASWALIKSMPTRAGAGNTYYDKFSTT